MATRQVDEEIDERTAIKKSYSQELGSSSTSHVYDNQASSISKRYILAFMAFLGFANVYAMRVNLSVAIVAMTSNYTTNVNGTEIQRRDFDWSVTMQGLILSSFFYGYIVTQLPGGWLAGRYGGKYLFGAGVLGTAVLTIITPPVAHFSPYMLIALRILEGLFEGVTYPCIHAMWAKWAPPLERSKLATIAFSGSYFGTVLSLPLSGIIADTIGWSWIFYIFGLVAMVWFVCWLWIVTESPQTHPTITHAELDYIQTTRGFDENPTQDKSVPWRDALLSLPVWAIIFAHFAENWGFYTMLTELPTFYSQVFKFDLHRSGFIAAIPYIVMVIMIQVGGQLADLIRRKEWLSTTNTRKAFNVSAFLGQTVFMIAVAYSRTPAVGILCLSFAVGIGGLAWAGFSVNHLDIAPQYAAVLMGVSNTFATIPGIVSPILTSHIAKHGTIAEWRKIFFLAGGVYCGGAVFYLLFASGRLQPWAEVASPYGAQVDDRSEHTQEEVDEAEDVN